MAAPTADLWAALAAPLPAEALVPLQPGETGRPGYPVVGYQQQYLVDRLNDVLGPTGWQRRYALLDPPGPGCRLTVTVTLFLAGTAYPYPAIGVCASRDPGVALQGALADGFRRACALFGLGGEALKGLLDPDLVERAVLAPAPTPCPTTPHPAQRSAPRLPPQRAATGPDACLPLARRAAILKELRDRQLELPDLLAALATPHFHRLTVGQLPAVTAWLANPARQGGAAPAAQP